MKNRLINGDCLDVLKTVPDNSIDSYVSDVPYGLGSKEPTPEEILAYLQGAVLKTGDFMGADWDIPSVEVWKEVYRVLKPGAYLISFGGTRTFDLISLGIRMAGFECRDTIFNETTEECVSVELPTLQWLYGSGMPKSHNVGKAIDKAQGLEREVVGHYQLPPDHARPNKNMEQWFQRQSEADDRRINYSKGMGNGKRDITAPASEDASKWEGWGSGLKPACEPILLFRKPFKGTLVNNVLTHGTGALNINASRVKHANAADFETHKAQVEAVRNRGGVRGNSWKNASDLSGANEVTADGRWPANLLLTHAPGCKVSQEDPTCVDGCPAKAMDEQSGERPSTLAGRADPNIAHDHPGVLLNPNSTFLGEVTHLSRVYADTGGASRFFSQFESEGPWECVEGCPVKALDNQSGILHTNAGTITPEMEGMGYGGGMGSTRTVKADSGGASRFFSQFDGVPFRYIPKASRKEAGCGQFEVQHPTVKPLALMRWLVRLVTPKGGTVLDSYCGSGSTLHAAVLEGFNYLGVERDPVNFEEAERRMKIVLGEQERQNVFEDILGC